MIELQSEHKSKNGNYIDYTFKCDNMKIRVNKYTGLTFKFTEEDNKIIENTINKGIENFSEV